MHRTYHLKIQCGDKVKGMTVACTEDCTYDDMMLSAISKFGADRVIELIVK